MIYQNFQTYSDIVGPVRAIADMASAALAQPLPGISRNVFLRAVAAICELIARAGLSHRRPAYSSGLRPYMKRHHVQTGVDHYGVFNGQRWKNYIYPILTNIIYASN